ncbi:MAG: 4-(cytidine 5'-diphospho)-2-C-methyl-D-erythritol kinase [Dehalococcoidia bacterium]
MAAPKPGDLSTVIALSAPAKLNLTLEVLGRRSDGYHELRSVLQTISLADRLTIEPAEDLFFVCDDPQLAGPDNLVMRAATRLREAAEVDTGARIRLEKHIPAAGGLGGGSSDAAAALHGLSRLWGLDWGPEQLAPLAAALGSDVPFFLWGGTALAEGRGERITPLPPIPPLWFVLLSRADTEPDKTRRIFSAFDPRSASDGSATERVVVGLQVGRIDPTHFVNDLMAPARRVFGEVEALAHAVDTLGARPLLAGAGPSLFCAATSRSQAEDWAAALERQGIPALVVRPVTSQALQ